MRLLLDTVTLIYAVDAPEKLSKRASAALRNPGNVLELSTISITEIAIEQSLGKLKVTATIVRQAVQDLDIRLLLYTGEHAFRLFELPSHHSDPFDCQIIAQALSEKISVVHRTRNSGYTADSRLLGEGCRADTLVRRF